MRTFVLAAICTLTSFTAHADTVSLPKVLNLKIDAPAGATTSQMMDTTMVSAPGFAVNVEVAGASRSKTAKEDTESASMYSPKNLKTDKLADGWFLTFDNTGSAGANYFLHVRRTIANKPIWCETVANSPADRTRALEACKSIRR